MKSPITPDIVNQLPGVSSPAISPDGTVVAYVRGQVEDGKRVSWIECAPFEGGDSRRLTYGDSDSAPAWSPDGSMLSFLRPSSAAPGAPRQIWLLPTDGGEASRLTDLPHSVAGLDWLPDGSAIIATVDIDPHRGERDGSRTTVVRDTYYRGDALGYREDAWHQLFRIDAQTGDAVQLTTGNVQPRAPGRLARRALGRLHGRPQCRSREAPTVRLRVVRDVHAGRRGRTCGAPDPGRDVGGQALLVARWLGPGRLGDRHVPAASGVPGASRTLQRQAHAPDRRHGQPADRFLPHRRPADHGLARRRHHIRRRCPGPLGCVPG